MLFVTPGTVEGFVQKIGNLYKEESPRKGSIQEIAEECRI